MDAILSESFVKFNQQTLQYPRKVPCHQMACFFPGGSRLQVPPFFWRAIFASATKSGQVKHAFVAHPKDDRTLQWKGP